MSLQDKINQAVEQLKVEVTNKVMSSSKIEYEAMITKIISDVYKTEDLEKIEGFTQKLDGLINEYTESEMGVKKISTKEYKTYSKGRKERKEKLTKILVEYGPEEKINLSELAERSGFNIKQLAGYTHGKDPLLIKDGESYKANILKKK